MPNLKFTLHNRNLAMPYTPAGIFLVDQWRQIGVDRRAQAVRHRALSGDHERRQLRRRDRLLQPVHGRALASASPSIVSFKRAPENRSRANDAELDKLYDAQVRERDADKRKELIRAFEKRLFEQAYQQPLLWWHRIVPTHKVVMGWKMSPSHNLGADLGEVWLEPASPVQRPRPGRCTAASRNRPREPRCSATPSTACC